VETQSFREKMGERRRIYTLARIQDDPRTVWQGLSEDEKTKEVIVAILEQDVHFFVPCPWNPDDVRAWVAPSLPEEFLTDRDVFLAFVKGERHDACCRWIVVPDFVRDDKEVMILVCEKRNDCLQYASPRLRDDKDVVWAAYFCNKCSWLGTSLFGTHPTD